MNFLGKVTIERPCHQQLVIQRQPGLLLWLFILVWFGLVTAFNLIFVAMFVETLLPQTLTCRSQRQTVNCDYVTYGLLSGKTIQIKDVKKAIASQKPHGETIVLTSSQPWIVLGVTDNNTQNIQRINQAIAQLHSRDQTWQLDMHAPAGLWQGVVFFFFPIGLLFFLVGVVLLLGDGPATFELDAECNTITITKLRLLRSHPASFNQLTKADNKRLGHLGVLSDKFGIYGGDYHYGYRVIRLLFTVRRPLTLSRVSSSNQSLQLVNSINAFIAEHQA
ncbi:MAG TPA: hypothetical protein DCP31_11085 [Cyanobacteria bacterium UBA8543]|nr:hypothetical protein [Cyanobacteria bacterium UBA8543]